MKYLFRSILSFLILYISFQTYSQGINCESAEQIVLGINNATGPVDGGGAANNCFPSDGVVNANWYQLINLQENSYVTISSSIDLNEPDTRLSVYSGNCDNLVCLVSDDDSGDGFTSVVSFLNEPETDYFIEWDDRWSSDAFTFEISAISSTIKSDLDGIPDIFDNCPDTYNPDQEDLDQDGLGDVCDFDDDNDGVLDINDCEPMNGEIYQGAPCSDGDPETLGDVIQEDCLCAGFNPLPGDFCLTAIPVSPGTIVDDGPNSGNGAITNCGDFTGSSKASWYTFDAEGEGTVTIYSCFGGTDTRLSVFRGSCDQLLCVTFSDDICEITPGGDEWASYVQFDLIPGESYFVEWDDRWSEDGFEWVMEFEGVPECPTLLTPMDGDIAVILDVLDNNSLDFIWQNETSNAEFNDILFGTDPNDLDVIGAVGPDDATLTLQNLEFETTYYWSIIPGNGVGDAVDCNIFSFTTIAENDTDSDGDGVFDSIDCDPADPIVYQGAECDDGDDETLGDIILNDCTCEGGEPQPGQFCESAISVSEGVFSNAGAQNIGGFNDACFFGATGALWYMYTATADGVIQVTSNGSDVDTRLTIFDSCNAIDCLYSNDDISFPVNPASSIYFEVIAGDIFYIQWDNFWTSEGFDFSIILDQSGDDTDEDGILNGIDNCSDVSNTDQADLDGDGFGDVCDDDIDGDFVLNDDDCEPLDATIFAGAICDDGDGDTFNDQIQPDCSCMGLVPETNTFCIYAIAIDIGVHFTNGPLIGGGSSNICYNGGTNSVWYQYIALSDGILTVSSAEDDVDTRLSIFNSCPAINCLGSNDDVSFPDTPGSEVNVPVTSGQSYWIEWDDQWSSNGFEFELSFQSADTDGDGVPNVDDNCPFEPNSDQVDLDNDGVGDICDNDIDGDGTINSADCAPLDASLYPQAPCDDGDPLTFNDQIQLNCTCLGTIPPTNQTCTSAIDVGEGSFTDPGPFMGSGASNICEGGAEHSNWYRYTPAETGYSIIYSCIDGEDTRISVYSGDCDDLTCIAFNDDECGFGTTFASAVVFNVEVGESYYFEWDDRWSDQEFNFIIINNSDVNDTDGDGIVDQEDNCFEVPNADQADLDQDFVGDACDDDLDGDFVLNDDDCEPLNGSLYYGASCNDGNELTMFDSIQEDCTCEGIAPDDDTDLDGVLDVFDNCIDMANVDQLDLDGDGIGDNCDLDIDGDFVLNEVDCDPMNSDSNEILFSQCNDGINETENDVIMPGCDCIGVIPADNIDCTQAELVGVGTFSTVGPVSGNGASNSCGSNANDAVWFEFVAEENGTLSISSSNDLGINTNLSVYDGCNGSCLGSNDNISETDLGSNVVIEVEEGESYLIEFDDLWSSFGFDFVIEFLVGIDPLGPDFITELVLFPNPTKEEINIAFDAKSSGDMEYTISDASGRIIFQENTIMQYGENNRKLVLQSAESGLYFLKITSKNFVISKPFVVME